MGSRSETTRPMKKVPCVYADARNSFVPLIVQKERFSVKQPCEAILNTPTTCSSNKFLKRVPLGLPGTAAYSSLDVLEWAAQGRCVTVSVAAEASATEQRCSALMSVSNCSGPSSSRK